MRRQLRALLHPYAFILKEGQKIQDNYLDYSLMILQVGYADTLRSPSTMPRKVSLPPSQPFYTPQAISGTEASF